jgi:hypothetical protein
MTENRAENYRKILALSERMLASARNGNWDNFIAEGKIYNETILGMPGLSADSESEECAAIIASILENGETIKSLVKSRMDDLQGALSSVSQSIKLNQAYR